MDSATRGSRRVFLPFSELSLVPIRMRSPSRDTHTGAHCGEPSAMTLARCAKFAPSSSRLMSSDSAIPMGSPSSRLEIREWIAERGAAASAPDELGPPQAVTPRMHADLRTARQNHLVFHLRGQDRSVAGRAGAAPAVPRPCLDGIVGGEVFSTEPVADFIGKI